MDVSRVDRRPRTVHPRDLLPRLATALVLAPLAILGVLLLPAGLLALAFGVALAVVVWEMLTLSGVRLAWARGLVFMLVLASLASLYLHGSAGWIAGFIGGGACVALGAAVWLRVPNAGAREGWTFAATKVVLGSIAVVGTFASMMSISTQLQGRGLLLLVMTQVCLLDTLSYFVGKYVPSLGRTPLIAPRVSPNKNVGVMLVSGLATLALCAAFTIAWHGIGATSGVIVAALALALAAAVVGDLASSLLKRQARVKDSGALLPGHGGAVDRMDSMLTGIPVFAAVMQLS